MTDLWICKKCSKGLECFSFGCEKPESCVNHEKKFDWELTDGYKIIKKTVCFDVEAHNSEAEAQRRLKESIAAYGLNKKTPNCATCRWIKSEPDPADDSYCPINYDCMAQGGADALSAYNNEQCQSLFEDRVVVSFVSAEDS